MKSELSDERREVPKRPKNQKKTTLRVRVRNVRKKSPLSKVYRSRNTYNKKKVFRKNTIHARILALAKRKYAECGKGVKKLVIWPCIWDDVE